MKRLRSELASAAAVFSLPAAILASVPFDAIAFRAETKAARPPSAAFVSLSAEEEAAALRAAKTSWNSEAEGVRRMRAELRFGELPECASEPALGIADRMRRPQQQPQSSWPPPYLPSQAAPAPAKIAPEKESERSPVFAREELLRMD